MREEEGYPIDPSTHFGPVGGCVRYYKIPALLLVPAVAVEASGGMTGTVAVGTTVAEVPSQHRIDPEDTLGSGSGLGLGPDSDRGAGRASFHHLPMDCGPPSFGSISSEKVRCLRRTRSLRQDVGRDLCDRR